MSSSSIFERETLRGVYKEIALLTSLKRTYKTIRDRAHNFCWFYCIIGFWMNSVLRIKQIPLLLGFFKSIPRKSNISRHLFLYFFIFYEEFRNFWFVIVFYNNCKNLKTINLTNWYYVSRAFTLLLYKYNRIIKMIPGWIALTTASNKVTVHFHSTLNHMIYLFLIRYISSYYLMTIEHHRRQLKNYLPVD